MRACAWIQPRRGRTLEALFRTRGVFVPNACYGSKDSTYEYGAGSLWLGAVVIELQVFGSLAVGPVSMTLFEFLKGELCGAVQCGGKFLRR